MMHLVYHGRFPAEKAAALFAARSVHAFNAVGIPTTLVAPRRLGRSRTSAQKYYELPAPINVIYLPTVDVFWIPGLQRLAFLISYTVFSIAVVLYALTRVAKNELVYTNEAFPAFLSALAGKRVVYEVHDFPEQTLWLYRAVCKHVERIIATNAWKKGELVSRFGVSEEKITVELNAVDLKQFARSESREEARIQLGLPADAPIVLYTGHLYSWKGADTLAEAASYVPDAAFYFVGGTEEDVRRFKGAHTGPTIHVMGHQPHALIPVWQRAAHVLVLPNSGAARISSLYTSPMKLFEYMASRTPIVASDVPAVREVLSEEAGLLVAPDNAEALGMAIREVLTHPTEAVARAEVAYQQVSTHDWEARARRIGEVLGV